MVGRVREKFVTQGFDAVFQRKKLETPPRQPIFDGEAQAKLIAFDMCPIACDKRSLLENWPVLNRLRDTHAGRCVCSPTKSSN